MVSQMVNSSNWKYNTQLVRKPKRAEKWVTLPNENLSLMQLMDVDVEMLLNPNKEKRSSEHLQLGGIYALDGGKIEGIDMNSTLFFRLYGIIREYKGVELNSLILKEVYLNENNEFVEGFEGSKRRRFSISPSMCKNLGIEFQPGYELWSMAEPFVKVELENKTKKVMSGIDYCNLSTYPTSEIDGTIRKVLLELHGFAPFNNNHIITPTGALVSTNDLLDSMTIFVRTNISTDNGCAGYREGDTLPFKVVARKNSDTNTVTVCDDKHNMYVEVDLSRKSGNVVTSDGMIGISPTSLVGKDIDDVIGVKWDESSTNNENEDKKKRSTRVVSEDEIDVQHVIDSLNKHFGPPWAVSLGELSNSMIDLEKRVDRLFDRGGLGNYYI